MGWAHYVCGTHHQIIETIIHFFANAQRLGQKHKRCCLSARMWSVLKTVCVCVRCVRSLRAFVEQTKSYASIRTHAACVCVCASPAVMCIDTSTVCVCVLQSWCAIRSDALSCCADCFASFLPLRASLDFVIAEHNRLRSRPGRRQRARSNIRVALAMRVCSTRANMHVCWAEKRTHTRTHSHRI